MSIKRIIHESEKKYEVIQSEVLILGAGMNLEITDDTLSLKVIVFFNDNSEEKTGRLGLIPLGRFSSQLTIYNSLKNEIIAPGARLKIGFSIDEEYLMDFIVKGFEVKREFKYTIYKRIKE